MLAVYSMYAVTILRYAITILPAYTRYAVTLLPAYTWHTPGIHLAYPRYTVYLQKNERLRKTVPT
jgi:hypothetical protein